MNQEFSITNEKQLEQVIGEPMEFVRAKIASQLDEVMMEFIERSPLIFVSTIDEHGQIDVSPKGDPGGFVTIDDRGRLRIPERPGNRLTFGFRNILRNREIGLIFLVPHQRETLRVKGAATLHNDPAVLAGMTVNGKPALMYTLVEITECFFHCGKALIRSKLWEPASWDTTPESLGARQFSTLRGGGEAAYEDTKDALEKAYREELY